MAQLRVAWRSQQSSHGGNGKRAHVSPAGGRVPSQIRKRITTLTIVNSVHFGEVPNQGFSADS